MHSDSTPEKLRPDLDQVIEASIRELERLAAFYHKRGDYSRAQEVFDVASTMRDQFESRRPPQ